ncbi:unnamed protein product [Adineta ricciae]|uniref:Uncharacterized protein n=1 Tax=Adineta ricciae TaxID=249248 RepID=A0A814FK81_ADIRI|nr:unnamed protein product [Adineta ricciae]CAF1034768.1 unnamed protein product [Adineta ricciae]
MTNASNTQRNKKLTKRILIEVIVAIAILAPAIYLCVNLKPIIIGQVLKIVELKPNSQGFETWLSPPTTITRGYHLFNISNAMEIVTDPSSTTIQLKETRAYDYHLFATKKDVRWSDDNKALSYSIYRLFNRHSTKFEPSAVNDTGVFVDLLRAIFRTQFESRPASSFFDLGGNNAFNYGNAIEQLEGFTSPLFETVREKMTGPNTAKSGFIYRYNGSRSYNFTIRSGLMEKGQVLSFASENVPFSFSSPDKYPLTIYDGLTFVPMLFDKPVMHIFQADFCRPITVKFNRVLTMFSGIDVHEYVIKFIDFDQCTNISDINTCPELDKLDVSKCISATLPDNTVFLSKPHFYGASNETMENLNIEGFTPTRDQHEALIYFEPYSGTPLRAHHRIQLNIDAIIDPMKQSEYGSELTPTKRRGVRRMIPLVWIDQEVNIDDATIGKLRLVHLAIRHGKVVIMVAAILLIILIIGILECLAKRATRKERRRRGGHQKEDPLMQQMTSINQ